MEEKLDRSNIHLFLMKEILKEHNFNTKTSDKVYILVFVHSSAKVEKGMNLVIPSYI